MTLGLFLRAPLRVDVLVCISKWHAKGQLTLTIFIHQSLPEWPNPPLLMNGNGLKTNYCRFLGLLKKNCIPKSTPTRMDSVSKLYLRLGANSRARLDVKKLFRPSARLALEVLL